MTMPDAIRRLLDSRVAQGLPERVTDPSVIRSVAAICGVTSQQEVPNERAA